MKFFPNNRILLYLCCLQLLFYSLQIMSGRLRRGRRPRPLREGPVRVPRRLLGRVVRPVPRRRVGQQVALAVPFGRRHDLARRPHGRLRRGHRLPLRLWRLRPEQRTRQPRGVQLPEQHVARRPRPGAALQQPGDSHRAGRHLAADPAGRARLGAEVGAEHQELVFTYFIILGKTRQFITNTCIYQCIPNNKRLFF